MAILNHWLGEQAGPAVVAEVVAGQEADQQDDRVQAHDDGGDALGQPVAKTVVGADDEAPAADVVVLDCHCLKHSKQFQSNQQGQEHAEGQHGDGRIARAVLAQQAMHVHEEMADACQEMMQIGPGQRQDEELDEPVRGEAAQVS